MKVCSAFVLAVSRWWNQAGTVFASIGCLGATTAFINHDGLDLDALTHKRRASHPLQTQTETEPPLSARSDASTASLLGSPSDDGMAFSGDLDESEALVVNAAVPVPDSDSGDESSAICCADPELEPELELQHDADATAKFDTASLIDVKAAAVALARRLVPLTTATGRFQVESDLSRHSATTSEQWKHYSAAKTAFADAARDYVVACAERGGAAACSNGDTVALVEAYAQLVSSPLFDIQQRAFDQEWEDAHAYVNAAAFLLISLAAQAQASEPELLLKTVTPVAGQRPLTALEQRLDDAHVLVLFRKTPEQLACAPPSTFIGVDTDALCLLELRALLHAASLSTTGSHSRRRQLQDAVRSAKTQFDDRRRAHWSDERGSSSRSCFFHGPSSEQVLPLYASVSPKLWDALTSYCDAEAATH